MANTAQIHHQDRRTGEIALITTIPAGTEAALKRLCGFYGGSEHEMLARVISDLERDTLATLVGAEREDYLRHAA
jgi:hypothetical protein